MAIVALVLVSYSFAQDQGKNGMFTRVIEAESGIRNITVSENIDLVLYNASPEEVKVSVPREQLDKIKITYSNGNLQISAKGFFKTNERIYVYAWVNSLESLTLRGNSSTRSNDILDASNLRVNIQDEARVALRSRGKVKVNAPVNYHRLEEERYHLLLSLDQE